MEGTCACWQIVHFIVTLPVSARGPSSLANSESLPAISRLDKSSRVSQYLAALAGRGPSGWGKKSMMVSFTRGKKCWISVAHSTPMKPAPTTNTVADLSCKLFRKLNLIHSCNLIQKLSSSKSEGPNGWFISISIMQPQIHQWVVMLVTGGPGVPIMCITLYNCRSASCLAMGFQWFSVVKLELLQPWKNLERGVLLNMSPDWHFSPTIHRLQEAPGGSRGHCQATPPRRVGVVPPGNARPSGARSLAEIHRITTELSELIDWWLYDDMIRLYDAMMIWWCMKSVTWYHEAWNPSAHLHC